MFLNNNVPECSCLVIRRYAYNEKVVAENIFFTWMSFCDFSFFILITAWTLKCILMNKHHCVPTEQEPKQYNSCFYRATLNDQNKVDIVRMYFTE
jgi:hypothetical protein